MSTPQPLQWHVFTADRHLVATYSTEAAAASHVACWPALYYSGGPLTTAADSDIGLLPPTTSA